MAVDFPRTLMEERRQRAFRLAPYALRGSPWVPPAERRPQQAASATASKHAHELKRFCGFRVKEVLRGGGRMLATAAATRPGRPSPRRPAG